jgi:hypothetical protein
MFRAFASVISQRMTRRWAAAGVLIATLSGQVFGATVINGGFETGDFTGWTVQDQEGLSGSWFVYSGTVSPLTGFPIPAPPEGAFAVISDQSGPGSHILYQDVALEPNQEHTLTFITYYINQAGFFATPDTLDANVFPNQQFRVDVVDPTQPVSSATGALIFRTEEGDPSTLDPTLITFDLTPFAGTTVRLRFAEVDNQLFFEAGVDDVRIQSRARTPQNKDECKKSGWQALVDGRGRPFKNEGDCVSFVVRRH